MNIGIDIGSREVKIYGKGKEIPLLYKKVSTIHFFSQYGKRKNGRFFVDSKSLGYALGTNFKNVAITATGYGKGNITFGNANEISEIQAHTAGAVSQSGLNSFTLLDIGGQDIKVVNVQNKIISDFVMNDRCAAGTGRYLENIAKILDMTCGEMGEYTKDPAELSHTCAIFAETEVVTKIAEGYPPQALVAGANLSVARRIIPLVTQFDNETLLITGGVAKNKAVIFFLRKDVGKIKIIIPKDPQFNGAIGCFASL